MSEKTDKTKKDTLPPSTPKKPAKIITPPPIPPKRSDPGPKPKRGPVVIPKK